MADATGRVLIGSDAVAPTLPEGLREGIATALAGHPTTLPPSLLPGHDRPLFVSSARIATPQPTVFLLGSGLDRDFADLFSSHPGATGEIFAFDGQGRMLSESRFLDDLRERAGRMCRMTAQAVVIDLGAPPLFGGCYLVGPESGGERAFSPGFWKRLDETQGNVAWTEAAVQADENYRRRTLAGYSLLAVATLLVIGLAIVVAARK